MRRGRVLDALAVVTVLTGTALAVANDDAAGPPEFVFGTVILLTLWAVLRLAGRAGHRAAAERTRAGRLASMPEAEVARAAVAVERARLAGDIQAVVRSAAIAMGSAADDAVRHWDDDPAAALRAVQEYGARAGLELRRLLGLLREAHDDVAAEPTTPAVPALRISRGDVVLACAATVLAVAENFAYRDEFPRGETVAAVSALLSGCAAATVVLRRVAPEVGAVACGLVFAAGTWTQPLASGFWFLLTPGSLTWAAVGRGPRGLLAVGVLAAGIGVHMAVRSPENVLISMLVLSAAAVGSAVVRISDVWGRSARARGDRRAGELAAAAGAAVRTERLAVARELHDLVSHAVGVMVMQAGAALATRESDPQRARRALDVVRRTAAETLQELDRLVEVLDHGVLGAATLGPDGHDLAALVERLRAAGLAVRADVDGELAGEVGAVVYRVVQESLTNVLRHAPGAGAAVRVRVRSAEVEVEVVDDGPGSGPVPRRGYGLVGIEERVHRLGGEFVAGPGPGGSGFRVHARVPTPATRPA
ncbi:sensor histidine kinase [Blastococcus deserti]|uniref:histidine kinase n=1 Tax=Blastococcus deserti TaxID=2259033 RepID=A0ABW4XCH4_9ACTN